jgi:hypothetical protein
MEIPLGIRFMATSRLFTDDELKNVRPVGAGLHSQGLVAQPHFVLDAAGDCVGEILKVFVFHLLRQSY